MCRSGEILYLWWKLAGKFLELSQLLANVDFFFSVEQQRHYGLCATGILYRLRREEQVVCRLVIVCAVFGCLAACLARGVFEEEYYAIDGAELLEL
jgi:hypothetical protein